MHRIRTLYSQFRNVEACYESYLEADGLISIRDVFGLGNGEGIKMGRKLCGDVCCCCSLGLSLGLGFGREYLRMLRVEIIPTWEELRSIMFQDKDLGRKSVLIRSGVYKYAVHIARTVKSSWESRSRHGRDYLRHFVEL